MEKFSTKLKVFFIILAVVFVLYVASLILVAYVPVHLGQVLHCILLFPIGSLLFMLGDYLRDYYGPTFWVYNENLGLFFIFVTIIGQTFVYYYIYKFVKARKKRKMEIQE